LQKTYLGTTLADISCANVQNLADDYGFSSFCIIVVNLYEHAPSSLSGNVRESKTEMQQKRDQGTIFLCPFLLVSFFEGTHMQNKGKSLQTATCKRMPIGQKKSCLREGNAAVWGRGSNALCGTKWA
jgi:hypothetical protein